MVQLLTPSGERTTDERWEPYRERAAHLDHGDVRDLWRDMVLVRAFDDEATSLQRQGQLGLWAQCLGQEAAQVGSGRALAPQDYAFPSYREHGVAHTRGVDLAQILRLFRGVDHGGWDGEAHRFHNYTLVIGSHTLHATGYAMGVQRDGVVGTGDPTVDTAVVTYFGDGATAQGDVNEALVFAAVNQAPLVLFCQNNQFAISEPNERQFRVPVARRGEGFGVPGVRVDGNDVLASYAVTQEALERARSGGGPSLVEAFTFRMGAHTTSDDPTRYRTRELEQQWRDRDPIARVEAMLRREGGWDDAWAAQVREEAGDLGARVRETVRSMPAPSPASMFDHVYATPHAVLEDERAFFAEYESGFADGGAR
ncbi:pyruvate dehydrogenase (acetyl-transferring) E1 component subunit alpha [Sanguibacter sp. HDW7]|nr:pyruvate dehydrogenase (acetyl-transferring) E1 component subunit alpha [Sanguibacter sp. HDW7]QIK85056.1 pyruvate dehydrogenase (acetyl-transferring) E1 component subunit alpha [Sanguibacter sp. HDW7]